MKCNLARRLKRKENRSSKATAQEPASVDLPTIPFKTSMNLATLNIRGVRNAVKRRDITKFMDRHYIDIMAIQETHNGEATRENQKRHTWYFSGGNQTGAIHHGVGIIIKNELRNYVVDVEPISERMMVLTLRGKITLYIISAYAPHAGIDYETKEQFHQLLREQIKKRRKQGMVIVGADMNTKFREPGTIEEEGVGPYIFGQGTEIEEGAGVEESRNLLKETLIDTNTLLINTYFKKVPEQQITYKLDKQAGTQPPWTKGRFDVTDYIMTTSRWKNSIKDVQSHIWADIHSDHYPITARIKVNLKANYRNNRKRHKYLRCSDAQQQSYNNKLNTTIPQDRDFSDISQWIQSAAADHVPQKQITNHPFEISDETTTLMTEKTKQYKEGKTDTELQPIRKAVAKSLRSDKRRHTAEMVSSHIDERDLFMGLRNLRKPFVATPLGMKDKDGKHIPFDKRADKAAEFFGTVIWGKQQTPPTIINQTWKTSKNNNTRS